MNCGPHGAYDPDWGRANWKWTCLLHDGTPSGRSIRHLLRVFAMPVIAKCPTPGCRGNYRVPDDRAGAALRCPLCKKTFTPTLELPAGETGNPAVLATATESRPAVPPRPNATPDRIGRYVVRKKLGQGNFGTVYQAYDPPLDREVALKVPNPGVLNNPKLVERFLREAKSAAGLRHPHIVPVYDTGRDGDQYYIASAFIDGQELSKCIEETGTDFRRAARLTRELAEALAYAHQQKIVHRDVKPANVMVDLADHIHLMDFGLAFREEAESKLTNDGAVMGTPAYMAPEQASRGSVDKVGPAADQYAVGVVLYELLSGRLPFADVKGGLAVLIYHVINTDPAPPSQFRSDVPRDLETICLKAMAKRPDDRYADCGELAMDLDRWLNGKLIVARNPGRLRRLNWWVRQRPAATTSLVFGLVLAVFAGVSMSRPQATSEPSPLSELGSRVDDSEVNLANVAPFIDLQPRWEPVANATAIRIKSARIESLKGLESFDAKDLTMRLGMSMFSMPKAVDSGGKSPKIPNRFILVGQLGGVRAMDGKVWILIHGGANQFAGYAGGCLVELDNVRAFESLLDYRVGDSIRAVVKRQPRPSLAAALPGTLSVEAKELALETRFLSTPKGSPRAYWSFQGEAVEKSNQPGTWIDAQLGRGDTVLNEPEFSRSLGYLCRDPSKGIGKSGRVVGKVKSIAHTSGRTQVTLVADDALEGAINVVADLGAEAMIAELLDYGENDEIEAEITLMQYAVELPIQAMSNIGLISTERFEAAPRLTASCSRLQKRGHPETLNSSTLGRQ